MFSLQTTSLPASLKSCICDAFRTVSSETLQCMWQEITCHIDIVRMTIGSHIEHLKLLLYNSILIKIFCLELCKLLNFVIEGFFIDNPLC